jgi:hypothetical protein
MIKVSASPDHRYGVTLSDGVSIMGMRQAIIKSALDAAGKGISVVEWIVPGKEKITRKNRGDLLHSAYLQRLP